MIDLPTLSIGFVKLEARFGTFHRTMLGRCARLYVLVHSALPIVSRGLPILSSFPHTIVFHVDLLFILFFFLAIILPLISIFSLSRIIVMVKLRKNFLSLTVDH